MPQKSRVSKTVAGVFVVLTVSAIAGIVAMALVYKSQIDNLHPTPRPTFPSITEAPPPTDLRLPGNLLPESYEVFIHIPFYTQILEEVNVTSPNQTTDFTGNSTVHFRCLEATHNIYLHSRELVLSDPVVLNEDTEETVPVVQVESQEDQDLLVVRVGEALQEGGNYSLFLAFQGEMMSVDGGLYQCTYEEGTPGHEGDTSTLRYMSATIMEPAHARTVFPCFDEPEMKAVFQLTVIHRRDTFALGNAAIAASNIIDDEWKFTRFFPTPKMSTYLFAFTVSEFTSTPSEHGRVQINLYARPEAVEKGHLAYAAGITGKILYFFEDHLGINYEMKKLDQIALPFLPGAGMENWGLITYDEDFLLYEDGVTALPQKEQIAITIAHELAHQWFGNLVTMKWWNELWLKEGFATYLSYMAVDQVEPTFKMNDMFVMRNLRKAFKADARTSSRPVSPPAGDFQTSKSLEELYDSITYRKGAVVLRMLANFVGESIFNDGIRTFLKTFQKQSVDQENLWDHIQKAYDNDVISISKMMHPWLKQNGFPVVTINTTSGEVYQKQFLFNNTAVSSHWWQIPIRFMSNTSDVSLLQLDVSGPVMKEEFISERGDWILLNVNCSGYYRVNYDPENWARLLTQLETDPHRIPVMNRAQLIDDAFNLARAQLVNMDLALNCTRFLRKEREYLPWKFAMDNLWYFVQMFDRSEVYGLMEEYFREQVKDLYNFLQNETDNSTAPMDHSSQHNQILSVQVACSFGLPECVTMAKAQYAEWMESNSTNSIHPNLRSAIYCQAIAVGGKEEWEFAWERYQSTSDKVEEKQLLNALSCTRRIWLLNRFLESTLDHKWSRWTDGPSIIENVALNPAGQALAWNFVRAHWSQFRIRHQYYIMSSVTSRFSTQFELEELERFISAHQEDIRPAVGEQVIEQVRVNIQWVGQNHDAVLHWFQSETA